MCDDRLASCTKYACNGELQAGVPLQATLRYESVPHPSCLLCGIGVFLGARQNVRARISPIFARNEHIAPHKLSGQNVVAENGPRPARPTNPRKGRLIEMSPRMASNCGMSLNRTPAASSDAAICRGLALRLCVCRSGNTCRQSRDVPADAFIRRSSARVARWSG